MLVFSDKMPRFCSFYLVLAIAEKCDDRMAGIVVLTVALDDFRSLCKDSPTLLNRISSFWWRYYLISLQIWQSYFSASHTKNYLFSKKEWIFRATFFQKNAANFINFSILGGPRHQDKGAFYLPFFKIQKPILNFQCSFSMDKDQQL